MSQPADLDTPADAPPAGEPDAPRHGFQGDRGKAPAVRRAPLGLSIAVSREAGARGSSIARRVGQTLGWQVYDQEMLEFMAQDAGARVGLLDTLPAPCLEWIERRLEHLRRTCGLGKDAGVLCVAQTVLALGAQGEAVLVGRGAGCVLPRESTLNVRIVSPLPDRIAYLSQWLRLPTGEAAARVAARDERRADFLRTHFGRPIADVHDYDLVLNSSTLGEETSAELITLAARLRWEASAEMT